jgi:phosphoribosylglycinamide formyltransferase-1
MGKLKLALFASGSGSNALKIMDHFAKHSSIEVGFVLSNKKDAPIVESATLKGSKVIVLTNEEVENGQLLTKICKINVYGPIELYPKLSILYCYKNVIFCIV